MLLTYKPLFLEVPLLGGNEPSRLLFLGGDAPRFLSSPLCLCKSPLFRSPHLSSPLRLSLS